MNRCSQCPARAVPSTLSSCWDWRWRPGSRDLRSEIIRSNLTLDNTSGRIMLFSLFPFDLPGRRPDHD